jgi:hypothetical protein
MTKPDDRKDTKPDFIKPTCRICNGIGFRDGKVCLCIGAKDPASIDNFFEMLGIKDPWKN